ncbi:uncharacterized protein LOC133204028 [Saccostrea echinata]|uniref:uncharacterized protein LOC133204028 n=1 Tax=Saccostrea echinata TaxID=191078 RepID=UPI002A813F83|nr:uncharacterized protein LOC133204028 [Saccostrea echinata]
MEDIVDLKQNMKALETSQEKTELEMNKLKLENERLQLEKREFEVTFNKLEENFTETSEHILGFTKQFEVDRETFEKNISARLESLKDALFGLNKHTLEMERMFPVLIEENSEILSTKLNTSLEIMNNDLRYSNANLSKSLLNIENSQNAAISSMFDDINKTMGDIRTKVKQSQYDQLKLSTTVSYLEAFQMNITRNLSQRVAFTVGVSSTSTSWNSGTLVYDKVINNVGGGYNPNTGIFTAPVEGNYVFYVTIQSYKNNAIYVDIVLNGSSKVRSIAFPNWPHEQYDTGTNLVTLQLQKGDAVWVRFNYGIGYWTTSDTPATTFSGFLM